MWGKRQFLKHPGTITLAIGPAISTTGADPAAVLNDSERWIENTIAGDTEPVRTDHNQQCG